MVSYLLTLGAFGIFWACLQGEALPLAAGLASFGLALPARAQCEGSTFNGTWEIPEGLGGKASIEVRAWVKDF